MMDNEIKKTLTTITNENTRLKNEKHDKTIRKIQ